MKRYLRHLSAFAAALWAYLTRGGLVYACRQMQLLNIWARRNGRYGQEGLADFIYDLKNRLVQVLYEDGHCVVARLDVDRKPCWGYRSVGYCTGRDCDKCNGTGIFSERTYYAFTFELPDPSRPGVCEMDDHRRVLRFRWHQPEHLVDWPVFLTHSKPRPFPHLDGDRPLPRIDLYVAPYVVWWALALRLFAPRPSLLDPVLPMIRWRRSKSTAFWEFQLYIPLLCLRFGLSDSSVAATWPSLRRWNEWNAWLGGNYRDLDWLGLSWRHGQGFDYRLAGRSPRELLAALSGKPVAEPDIEDPDYIPF